MEKLKSDEYTIHFYQLDEEGYDELVMWGVLLVHYPFCTGLGFEADLAIYHKLVR